MDIHDIELLQFFGFGEEESAPPGRFVAEGNISEPSAASSWKQSPQKDIYSLFIIPRKRFKKDMILNLPESILYSMFKNIQNTKHESALKILESSIKKSSYYSKDKKQNALKRDKIERLKLLIISFMSLGEGIVDKEYNTKMEEINDFIKNASKSNPKEYKKALIELSDNVKKVKARMVRDISIILIPIFENSELLGDVILNQIVEDISQELYIKTQKCSAALKNFLNSNVFLNHILKKIDFDITKIIPNMEREKIRLSKRDAYQSPGREEKITKSCIDFKYNANLFEQLIAFVYTQKGYKYTASLFRDILSFINFSPKSFIKHCEKNTGIPYDKIKLQPGCSCIDSKTQTSICDNPGPYDPLTFYNMPCPKKCS